MNWWQKMSGALQVGSSRGSVEDEFASLLRSLLLMAWFVEARDPYTGGHLWRVSRYAQLLSGRAGRAPVEIAQAGLGGFLHDLGKIGISDSILAKPGRLTDAEYDEIKTHPQIGLRLLGAHPLVGLVRDAVHLHHERPDGRGYPLALAHDDIPDLARLIGVVDAFDAMTSARPYRAPMPIDKALGIIAENSGTQFDPLWAELLLELRGSGELEHIQGHSDDGIRLQDCPMCGPTLVVRRDQHEGDSLYCRSCNAEFELQADADGALAAVPTGQEGSAAELEPVPDTMLIDSAIQRSIELMPRKELARLL